MAEQLLIDLYGCDVRLLDDLSAVKRIAKEAIESIDAEIVEECVHKFEPIGISYVAVITTSHLSIHTWPEFGYAAIDVFSCAPCVPGALADAFHDAFKAHDRHVMRAVRKIENDQRNEDDL